MDRQTTLRIFGAFGVALFSFFFSLTFYVPGWVEDFAAGFIEQKVSEKIDHTIESVQPPAKNGALSRFANSIYETNEAKIENLRASLKIKVHEKMAQAIADVRNLDCECRNKYAALFEQNFQSNIALLQAASSRVEEFIHSKYMEVQKDLKRDIRIFSGTNVLVFLLLLLVSYMKPQAVVHLFVPAILLLLATLCCSYFYIFEQNWLLTIIYNNYWGFAYLAYLGVVFMFLCDVVLNSGHVTTAIINGICEAFGSAFSVVPC